VPRTSGKVIVGYDGSEESRDGLALGCLLAGLTDRRLILAAVLPVKSGAFPDGHDAAPQEQPERLFGPALSEIEAVDVETTVLGGKPPAEALHDLAETEGADAIVLGSTHRGSLGRILPGSVGERLLHGSPCAVAVAPRGFGSQEHGEPRVIAVAFDGSSESWAALEAARGLAQAAQATLRVLSVHEPFRAATAATAPMGAPELGAVTQRERMHEQLQEAVHELPAELRAKGTLLKGEAARMLLAEAALGVDVLVMGSRGYGPIGRVLLGGVSAKVMRSAPCPVLVVPRGAAGGRAATHGAGSPPG
jgi:nucleotide-binding universal stress UspA family protein